MIAEDRYQHLDLEAMAELDRYKLLTGVVVPRPIALVSTMGQDGIPNLAPFSFFNALCHDPVLVMFSTLDGNQPKDTQRNIEDSGEFVIAIPSVPMVQAVDICGFSSDPSVDEFKESGLTPAPAHRVSAPLVAEADINLECILSQFVPLGGGFYQLVIGQVLIAHVAKEIRNERGHIDAVKLRPLGRVGGRQYTADFDLIKGDQTLDRRLK